MIRLLAKKKPDQLRSPAALVAALLLSIASCSSEDPVPRRMSTRRRAATPRDDTFPRLSGGPQFSLAGGTLDDRMVARELSLEQSAVDALARIGAAAVPAVVRDAGRSRPGACAAMRPAHRRMGPKPAAAVPAVAAASAIRTKRCGRTRARALGEIGPAAEEAVPALIDELRQER